MPLIKIEDLKKGMKIGANVYSKDGRLLLEKNVRISSMNQIEQLKRNNIKFVNATTKFSSQVESKEPVKQLSPTENTLNEISSKITQASQQINKVMNLTGEVFNKIVDEKQINAEMGKKSKEIVGDFIHDIEANPEIYSSLEEIKEKDASMLKHSVHVSTNAILMGLHLELPKDQLLSLGVAALLHDIGKIKIDNKILFKIGGHTDEEMESLRKHPEFSLYYLKKMGNLDPLTMNLVMTHHENYDGKGYPKGIKNTDQLSLLLVLSNVYNNLIAHPDPTQKVRPVIALRKMGEQSEKMYSKESYLVFLNTVGFYPVGTLVQLANGDVGKVILQNKEDPQHPKVLIKFDKFKKPKSKIIDTSLKTRAGSASKYIHNIGAVIDT